VGISTAYVEGINEFIKEGLTRYPLSLPHSVGSRATDSIACLLSALCLFSGS